MSVAVIFPDGTQRRVMAELRLDTYGSAGAVAGRFVQCPINADPLWRYIRRNGQWVARPRFGSLKMAVMSDPTPWWDGIASMSDEDEAKSRQDRTGPRRHAA